MAQLSDAQLLAAISSAEELAIGSVSGIVSADRADAMDRYYGKAYGDELPGRSSVVSRDVADVVEGVVANVVKPILSGDSVVQFQPIGPEDEAAAKQEGDYCHHVAFEKNNGFVWTVSAVKDALLQRTGYVKCSWEVRTDEMIETYAGLTDEELTLLVQDDDVEVIQHTGYPDPVGEAAAMMQQPAPPAMAMMQGQQPAAQQPPQVPMLHDVKVRKKTPTEYVRVDPVPPNEILVTNRARVPSVQDVDFVQHRTHKTLSELRQAGYDVDDDVSDDDQGDNAEDISRQRFATGGEWTDETGLPERRIVLFKETWIRVDRDGDGVAELRRVCTVGENILADEDADIVPIACYSGVIVPHQHLGLSVYDLVEDLAKIKTALIRSYLDNRYLQNNGRYAVNADLTNIDDFLVSRPGGVVRVMGDPSAAIMPLVAPDTSTGALQGLEYLDSIREQRTGYTRNSAGIDNDALTNRTAAGMSMQLSQSQLRLEMIARTIAETGVLDTFRIIHAMTLKHSAKAEKVQLNGKWVEVNPREWIRRSNIRVSMGIGIGTPEQQLAKLMGLMPVVQQAQMAGLVGVQQVYALSSEAFKLSGYKSPDKFLKPPQIDPQTGQPKEPQPPPPEAVQVEQIRQQGDQAKLQAQTQSDAQKFQAEQAFAEQQAQRDAALKQQEQQNALTIQQQNDERDAARAAQQAQLDAAAQERAHQLELHKIAVEDARERDRMLLDAQLRREEMQIKAQASIAVAAARPKPEARPQ